MAVASIGNVVLLADSVSAPRHIALAEKLAEKFAIDLVQSPDQITTECYLKYSDAGLALAKNQTDDKTGPYVVRCDFVTGAARHRRLFGGGVKQPLARAVGLSAGFKPLIADLTAGLGRDGFVLASLGAQVVLVERNDIVAALLSDGLDRLSQAGLQENTGKNSLQLISKRLTMHNGDSKSWLHCLTEDRLTEDSFTKDKRPDVIYLDPMFPERFKSAKVKKEMAIFQGLVGSDEDAGDLLMAALEVARYRVVVKRPRRASPLAGIKASFSIDGKTTRFDIHAIAKMPR